MVTIMSENFAPMRTGTYPRKATMTRILIVEDEESYREPLVYQLTREGYDVSAAATGEEGLELFTKGGIVVSVQKELGVPVKLVGLGEGPDDLAPFDPEGFVDGILA